MHPQAVRAAARELVGQGRSVSATAAALGVSRDSVRRWQRPGRAPECVRCRGELPAAATYAALLGYYLGDGHIATYRGKRVLRVSCDLAYPGIIADVTDLIRALSPHAVHHVRAPGCVVVTSGWKHWTCLFPQHGPGRKHDRTLALAQWQEQVVHDNPGPFLRGLLHSDGCRTRNWARSTVGGVPKRYDYPRWQFVNASEDIRGFLCEALDLVGVPWRHSASRTISVSTRAGVARLDELVGLKS